MAEQLQNDLIQFMFRRHPNGTLDVMECLQLWFGKRNETDIEIEERFAVHVKAALDGAYTEWSETPLGCVAYMILVDQFPRNLFRNNVRSFSGDKLARKMAYTRYDWLEVLKPEECLFVPCLVMTHQENVADQGYGLEFYEKLEPFLPTELRVFRTIFEEHHRIIYLCGTFPHRDHYYPERTTSDVGLEILNNPKLRFDLPLVCKDGVVSFGHDASTLWHVTNSSLDIIDRIDVLVNRAIRRRNSMKGSWLTPKQTAEMKSMFRQFDKDGSGFLDVGELASVLESTGHRYTPDQVQAVVNSITGTHFSKGLTFDQFANILQINLSPSDYLNRSRARFDLFDLDRSGEVSLPEFAKWMNSLDSLITTSEIEAMFERADKDRSGAISFEEFLAIMEEQTHVDEEAVAPALPLPQTNPVGDGVVYAASPMVATDEKQKIHVTTTAITDTAVW